jgi:hypothetical protein
MNINYRGEIEGVGFTKYEWTFVIGWIQGMSMLIQTLNLDKWKGLSKKIVIMIEM